MQDAIPTPPAEPSLRAGGSNTRQHAARAVDLSEAVASLVAEVAEDRRLDLMLEQIAGGLSAETGEHFFRVLAEHLGESLEADFVVIGEVAETPGHARSVVMLVDGSVAENVSWSLPGTPCEAVFEEARAICYEEGVARRFPEDEFLETMEIEAYVGAPLVGSDGRPLGLLSVMYRRPLEKSATALATLRIFATRAAAELDRLHREEALRASEHRFRQLAEHSGVGIWHITPEGRTIFCNPAMCRMLEVSSPKELAGATIEEFFTPESMKRIREERTKRLEAVASQYEVELIGRRGTRRNVLLFGAPIMNRRGDLVALIGTLMDITERTRAMEEMRRRRDFERLLFSELDHRVRNNLSSLVSLIDLARNAARTPEELADAVSGRLRAMATAHAFLSGRRWEPLPIGTLIHALLPDTHVRRVVLEDDVSLQIPPQQTTSLAMVLHELIANSQKYGALRSADGRIRIRTSIFTSDDGGDGRSTRRAAIRWTETGGPPLKTPQPSGAGAGAEVQHAPLQGPGMAKGSPPPEPGVRGTPVSGVGTLLIEGLVRSDLRGRVEFNYPPEGADHRIEFTLANRDQHPLPPRAEERPRA